ncbi:Alpha-tubulin [Hexamita inflata]|uniref:Alpha-tubulin n=1 Tax=Hexamita inflata TaxID=28002 RepID=A0AA86QG28_9EUKA|nr:Alpha-tubulin [Hexamita inflata]
MREVINIHIGQTGTNIGTYSWKLFCIEHCIDRAGNQYSMNQYYPESDFKSFFAESTVLASKQLMESDAVFAFDNESIVDICQRNLGIEAKHLNVNKLIAHTISKITASIRKGEALNADLQEIQTNHVPYPRINCLVCSNAPFIKETYSINRNDEEQRTTAAISKAIFEPANVMFKCNLNTGKYIACSMVYRGNVVPKDVEAACCYLKTKRTVQFIDWCPTEFKVGINLRAPEIFYKSPESDIARVQRSCMLIANHTSISDVWNIIATNFDILFAQRTFVHHYVHDGIEESEFVDARNNLEEVQQDFDEIILKDLLNDDNF